MDGLIVTVQEPHGAIAGNNPPYIRDSGGYGLLLWSHWGNLLEITKAGTYIITAKLVEGTTNERDK